MKRANIITLAAILVTISALVYVVHYIIFRDPHHIFIFMVSDLAFVFLEVVIVIILIERILARREKRAMLYRLNMVAGAFFSEAGVELLSLILNCFEDKKQICPCLAVAQKWSHDDFKRAIARVQEMETKPSCSTEELDRLREFLLRKRPFLLRLLENPNLLEHEAGSDLLWAVFHLAEELQARALLGELPPSDLAHLAIDVQRAYIRLAAEWLAYMEHLQSDYPFLFSLFVRTNPFQEHPSPVVTQ